MRPVAVPRGPYGSVGRVEGRRPRCCSASSDTGCRRLLRRHHHGHGLCGGQRLRDDCRLVGAGVIWRRHREQHKNDQFTHLFNPGVGKTVNNIQFLREQTRIIAFAPHPRKLGL
jgi:hypothetical protein